MPSKDLVANVVGAINRIPGSFSERKSVYLKLRKTWPSGYCQLIWVSHLLEEAKLASAIILDKHMATVM